MFRKKTYILPEDFKEISFNIIKLFHKYRKCYTDKKFLQDFLSSNNWHPINPKVFPEEEGMYYDSSGRCTYYLTDTRCLELQLIRDINNILSMQYCEKCTKCGSNI